MNALLTFFKEYRLIISRIFGLLIILLLLFSTYSWEQSLAVDLALNISGFVLVILCTFGRLWTLAYISGHKTTNLITVGPYSMVRNPLYFCSLLGSIGIGLASKNLLVLGLIVFMFIIYYPFVIRAEEKNLEGVHGQAFLDFKKKVPMFIPRFSQYATPEKYEIDTRLFRRSFFSAVWFPLIYMLVLLIDVLHAAAILPTFISIP